MVFSKGILNLITIQTVVITVNDINPKDPNTSPINISAVIVNPVETKQSKIDITCECVTRISCRLVSFQSRKNMFFHDIFG